MSYRDQPPQEPEASTREPEEKEKATGTTVIPRFCQGVSKAAVSAGYYAGAVTLLGYPAGSTIAITCLYLNTAWFQRVADAALRLVAVGTVALGTVALRVTDKTEMGSIGFWITTVKKCFNLEHIASDTSIGHFDFSLRGPIRRPASKASKGSDNATDDASSCLRGILVAAIPLVLTIIGNSVCPDKLRQFGTKWLGWIPGVIEKKTTTPKDSDDDDSGDHQPPHRPHLDGHDAAPSAPSPPSSSSADVASKPPHIDIANVSETEQSKKAREAFIRAEDALLSERRKNNSAAIRSVVLGTEAAAARGDSLEGPRAPRVGVLISGGGWRAMYSGAAFIDGLAETGLLDCSEAVFGLSGGSWCVAQFAFGGANYNPFHMSHGPNPWSFGQRPDPTKHTFDGIIKMLSNDHVKKSYDIHDSVWSGLWSTLVTGTPTPKNPRWAVLRQLYLKAEGTDDDTLFRVWFMSNGAVKRPTPTPIVMIWADFIGRDTLDAWCDDVGKAWDALDLPAVRDAVKSGALPNIVMNCISSDVRQYGNVTSDDAGSKNKFKKMAPHNVWCEYTVAGMRNYAQQQVHPLENLRHLPVTHDDEKMFLDPRDLNDAKFVIRGADRMAMCGSAFAPDCNEPLGKIGGRIWQAFASFLSAGWWKLVKDGQGLYLSGAKTIVADTRAVGNTVATTQIGRIRDAGLDFNVPYPGAMSPDDSEEAGKQQLHNLIYTSGRKFDVLLVHDAGGGETGAATLGRCIDQLYYELSPELHPRGQQDLGEMAEAKNGNPVHDQDQIGRFRIFYPKGNTTLPIMVFMLGVCCESTGRVIYDEATILNYLSLVRERTACTKPTGQANNKCIVGPNCGEGYYVAVKQILTRLLENPTWRGEDLGSHSLHHSTTEKDTSAAAATAAATDASSAPTLLPPAPNETECKNEVNLESLAETLRQQTYTDQAAIEADASSSDTAAVPTSNVELHGEVFGHEFDTQFARTLVFNAFEACGIDTPGEKNAAFLRFANMIHRHALAVIAHKTRQVYHGPPCTARSNDPLLRIDIVMTAVQPDTRLDDRDAMWIPYEMRQTQDAGIYPFVLAYAMLRSEIQRDAAAPATERQHRLNALDAVFMPQPKAAIAAPEVMEFPQVATTLTGAEQDVLGNLAMPPIVEGYPILDFPRTARYMADAAALLHFSKVHGVNAFSMYAASHVDPRIFIVNSILEFFASFLRKSVIEAELGAIDTYSVRHLTAQAVGVEILTQCITAFQQQWSWHFFHWHQKQPDHDDRDYQQHLAQDTAGKHVQIPDDPLTVKWLGGFAALAAAMQPVMASMQQSVKIASSVVLLFLESVMRSDNAVFFDAVARAVAARSEDQRNAIAAARGWLHESVDLHDLIGSGNYDAVERFITRRRAELLGKPDEKVQFLQSLEPPLMRAMELDSPEMAKVLLEHVEAAVSGGGASAAFQAPSHGEIAVSNTFAPITSAPVFPGAEGASAKGGNPRAALREHFANVAVAAGKWREPRWVGYLQRTVTRITINDAATAVALLDFARTVVSLRRLVLRVSGDEIVRAAVIRTASGAGIGRSDEQRRHTIIQSLFSSLHGILYRGPITQLRDVDFGAALHGADETVPGSRNGFELVQQWLESRDSDKVATVRARKLPREVRVAFLAAMTTSQRLVEAEVSPDGSVAVAASAGTKNPMKKIDPHGALAGR